MIENIISGFVGGVFGGGVIWLILSNNNENFVRINLIIKNVHNLAGVIGKDMFDMNGRLEKIEKKLK